MPFYKYYFALSKEVAFISEGVTRALQYEPSLEAESDFFDATVQKVRLAILHGKSQFHALRCFF